MPQMAVYDQAGEKTTQIEVPDEILGLPFNADLVQQAVTAVDYARKRRCGKAKDRGEVSITGAKWYRQKGTGRARHGDQAPPHFVGGGVAHGPKGIQPTHKMPKQMRRKATYCALSARAREGAFTIIDKLQFETISTKKFAQVLADLEVDGRILLLLSPEEARDEVIFKSVRNIQALVAREVPHFNVRDVLWADEIMMTQAALTLIMGGAEADAD
ncbi:50S ribosomal protein L4 [bacterium]|nr:50S ribosomal protein L4 [bacterium]